MEGNLSDPLKAVAWLGLGPELMAFQGGVGFAWV
jgi:hypothetical protein